MSESKSQESQQPSLPEAIQRGWDWVVFSVKVLARVGGIKEWMLTFRKIISILLSRSSAQRQLSAKVAASEAPPIPVVQRTFYQTSEFAFAERLEANWLKIRQELEALQGEHFVDWSERYLYKEGWSTFGLYAFGIRIEKNCSLCPETTKLVEQIPNLVTAGFSSLAAGTHIAPHTGYPDGVLRCHLGLVIPENCAIRIGDETRTWQEGKCLIFDDTIDHEAWNNSDRTRVVLLLDFKPQG
jgi:beta-hydroxylase